LSRLPRTRETSRYFGQLCAPTSSAFSSAHLLRLQASPSPLPAPRPSLFPVYLPTGGRRIPTLCVPLFRIDTVPYRREPLQPFTRNSIKRLIYVERRKINAESNLESGVGWGLGEVYFYPRCNDNKPFSAVFSGGMHGQCVCVCEKGGTCWFL